MGILCEKRGENEIRDKFLVFTSIMPITSHKIAIVHCIFEICILYTYWIRFYFSIYGVRNFCLCRYSLCIDTNAILCSICTHSRLEPIVCICWARRLWVWCVSFSLLNSRYDQWTVHVVGSMKIAYDQKQNEFRWPRTPRTKCFARDWSDAMGMRACVHILCYKIPI